MISINKITIGALGLILLGIFANCVSSKNIQPVEAKIIDVYSQKYKGGIKGTPSGIKYKLFVIAPANQDEFKTIGFWVDNKFAPAKAFRNKIGVNKSQFGKGDTVLVQANYMLTSNGYLCSDSSINVAIPAGYDAKVVLLYQVNDKQKYISHNEIKSLAEELRP